MAWRYEAQPCLGRVARGKGALEASTRDTTIYLSTNTARLHIAHFQVILHRSGITAYKILVTTIRWRHSPGSYSRHGAQEAPELWQLDAQAIV